MKAILTSSLVIVLAAPMNAQSIEWMRDAGATPFSAAEHGSAVDVDTDGNSYVLGHLTIDSQFSGLPVPAHQDGCLAKYDANGAVQWVRTFGGPGFVDIQEMAVKVSSAENAVYVCGSFRTQFANPTVSFDTISFTFAGNSRHAFLAKYDLNGNIQWMRHGGGAGIGAGFNDLDIDDQGHVIAVGTADGTTVFDGQTITYDGGLLARYLDDGTLTDLVQLNDSSANQEAMAVEVAPGTGNIYVGGGFFGPITLDGHSATSSTSSIYVLKLDDGLTGQWIASGGGDNTTYGSYLYGLAIDAAENSYITGQASGDTVTFGSNSFIGHTFYDDEVITAKLDPNGVFQWLRRGGSEQNDEAFDIIADAQGNTVITGILGGNISSADFDGLQVDIVSQSIHCFIARYDPNGLITYAERMGAGSDDVGSGLALASDSTFFLTGTTWGSTPWLNWNYQSCCADPNLFIAKLNDTFIDFSLEVGDLAINQLIVAPNPAADQMTVIGLSDAPFFTIHDNMGREMHFVVQNGSVDVTTWSEGIYFVKAEGRTQRLIVQH